MKQQTTPKCDFCESEHTNCVKLINDDWTTTCKKEEEIE
jgi:hypothetical protein